MSDEKDGTVVQKFFDGLGDTAVLAGAGKNDKGDVGFRVEWSVRGTGFGEFNFYTENGALKIDNESMSRGFIKEVLGMLVDSATLTDDRG